MARRSRVLSSSARDLRSVLILVLALFASSCGDSKSRERDLCDPGARTVLPSPITNAWRPAGDLAFPRIFHTMTLLRTGEVLVAGGNESGYGGMAETEIFDPGTGTFRLGPSMHQRRYHHSATLLRDGRVLVAGGMDGAYLSSAEVFDPEAGSWTVADSMQQPHEGQRAILLADGRVLLVSMAGIEIYDPVADRWTTIDPPNDIIRAGYPDGAAALCNGEALLPTFSSSGLFSPSDGTWRLVDGGQAYGNGAMVPGGRILFPSGNVFDPGTSAWTPAAGWRFSSYAKLAPLPSGRVLLSGGRCGNPDELCAQSYAGIFDPDTNSLLAAAPMARARFGHAAVRLASGEVLVTGGESGGASDDTPITAELYTE